MYEYKPAKAHGCHDMSAMADQASSDTLWLDARPSVHNSPTLAFLPRPPLPSNSTTMPLRTIHPSLLTGLSSAKDPAFSQDPSANPISADVFPKPSPERAREARFSQLSMLPSPSWNGPSHPYLTDLQAVPLSDDDLAATTRTAVLSPSGSSSSSSWSSHDSSEAFTSVDGSSSSLVHSPSDGVTKSSSLAVAQRGRLLPPAYVADPTADPSSSSSSVSINPNLTSTSPPVQDPRRNQNQRRRTSSRPPAAEIRPIDEEEDEVASINRLHIALNPSVRTPPQVVAFEARFTSMPQPQVPIQHQQQPMPPRPAVSISPSLTLTSIRFLI